MKGWFGPKLIGYGVGPRSWQGWLASLLVLAGALATRFIPWQRLGLPRWCEAAWPVLLLVMFLTLVRATYDPDI